MERPVLIELASWVDKALSANRPLIVLRPLAWDDHRHRVTFRIWLRTTERDIDLGEIKIAQAASEGSICPDTKIPSGGPLSEKFISRFQDGQAYEKLGEHLQVVREALREVSGLEDAAALGWPSAVLRKTLFRFLEASSPPESKRGVLRISAYLEGFAVAHQLDLRFGAGLDRCAAIVGNNGTGKTQLLAAVARACTFSSGEEMPFRGAVVISFNPFDSFRQPRYTGQPGASVAHYAGLRNPDNSVDLEWARREVRYELTRLSPQRWDQWRWVWSKVRLFEREGAFAGLVDAPDADELLPLLELAAAGHQMVVMALVHVVAQVDKDQIVLFDEPEAHLHPQLVSTLIRVLHTLMERFDAWLLMATHSAIPVQEIPAHMVRVLTVEGRVPACRPLRRQSFGEDLGTLQEVLFHLDPLDQNWQTLLNGELAKQAELSRLTYIWKDLPIPLNARAWAYGRSKDVEG